MTAHGKPWSAADILRLKELWARGISGAGIGQELGRGRNAVLGKARRMKLRRKSRKEVTLVRFSWDDN